MADIVKGDDMLSRLQAAEDSVRDLQAGVRRRVLNEFTITPQTTTSITYVDLGPTVQDVRPGPSGLILVGLTVRATVDPNTGVFVSFRIATGPTVVASSDTRAWIVENNNAGSVEHSSTFFTVPPVLDPGKYDVVMTIRSAFGGLVGVAAHGVTVQPI